MEFGDMFLCQTNNRGLLKLKKSCTISECISETALGVVDL